MSERSISILIEDMQEAIQSIQEYTLGMHEIDFLADKKTKDAVLRNLEVCGEAARKIPKPFRLTHPEIEWQKIIASRHIVAHDYFRVDYEIVWRIVSVHLPPLMPFLQNILDELDANEAPS